MLWQIISQPCCIGEEGVEVGIDKGFGDLEATCVVSHHSADSGEIIEWDLDYLSVGFMGSDIFDPGPALRVGDPSQSSHVLAVLPK